MNLFFLYFRTIRYLRVSQIWHRLRLLVLSKLPTMTPGIDTFSVGSSPTEIAYPFSRPRTLSYLGGWWFSFLNEAMDIGGDWAVSGPSRLWRFNLHYFGFLLSMTSKEDQLRLILDWIRRVPPGGKDAWHSYVISLRICNWIVTISDFLPDIPVAQRALICRSLAQQLRHLNDHLEWDVLGNHLLENCKSLIVGGVFLDRPEYWRQGYDILMGQLDEQILSDGGHYERSPMYHFIVLETVSMAYKALLVVKSDLELAALRAVLMRMCTFGRGMLFDGQFPLWNDSAYGIVEHPEQVLQDVSVLLGVESPESPVGVTIFEATGYVSYRADRWSWTVDMGPGGPDFLMGHAHNDCLGFTLRCNGHDIVTDSGVYEYQMGESRDYFRSTAAHNTLRVNGGEQSETWASFRVGRRAHIRDFFYDESTSVLEAWHTGYEHVGVRVGRQVCFAKPRVFQVRDLCRSDRDIDVESYIHFAPGVMVRRDTDTRYILEFEQGRCVLDIDPGWCCVVEESWYSPQFSKKEQRLSVTLSRCVVAGDTCSFGYAIGSYL